MRDTADRLASVVRAAAEQLRAMTDEEARRRPAPGKWAPIEIVGHLVDSACNNHRRLVLALSRDDFVFDRYEQDAWVDGQRYREAPWADLVGLWAAYNLHLSRVMDAIPDEAWHRERRPHTLHRISWQKLPEEEPATLAWFAADYAGHLEHHLRQIPVEF